MEDICRIRDKKDFLFYLRIKGIRCRIEKYDNLPDGISSHSSECIFINEQIRLLIGLRYVCFEGNPGQLIYAGGLEGLVEFLRSKK